MNAPPILAAADFATVRLTLELLDACRLEPCALLGLRRELVRAGRELFGAGAELWFDPPLSSDPQALRRFQKPAPAFVVCPRLLPDVRREQGDTLDLSLLFLGSGLQQLDGFLKIFSRFGRSGLLGGGARFDVIATECLDASGKWRPLRPAPRGGDLAPTVLSVGWWLDSLLPLPEGVSLTFATPARLVVHGAPLRRPRFQQLFPFILRRATSMLYYHCGLEPVEDLEPLFQAARTVEAEWETVHWVDWHDHRGVGGETRLGGLTGRLHLGGKGLEELGWLLLLSTLFGVGRGASYGAGRLELSPR